MIPPGFSDGCSGRKAKSDAFGKIASPPMKRRFSHQRLQRHAPRVYELQRLARDRSLTPAETAELEQELANVFSAAEKAEVEVLGAAKVLRACGSDSPKGKRLQRLRDQGRHLRDLRADLKEHWDELFATAVPREQLSEWLNE